ncbi:MAG: hypothetical protein GWN37_02355 [Gammaproteobacteria bacterium]|nr:hypothetical protein [Gammaproteobacteria bacterium]
MPTSLRWSHRIYLLGACALVISAAAALTPFIELAGYSFPAADDYCLAVIFSRDDPLRALWGIYLGWSGRYFSIFLHSNYPNWFGMFEGYRYIAYVLLAGTFVAAAFAGAQALRMPFLRLTNLSLAAAFLTLFVLTTPQVSTAFYWLAGAFTYQLGNILLLIVLALCIQALKNAGQVRTYVLLGLALTAAIGCNEINMLTVFALLHLVTLLAWRSGRSLRPWLAMLALTYLSSALVYFAPGNATRLAAFPHGGDLMYSLSRCWHFGRVLLGEWTREPLFWIFLAFTFLSVAAVSSRPTRASSAFLTSLIAATTVIIPFVLLFPPWWSTGGMPPDRTVNTIYFIFLLSATSAAMLAGGYFGPHLQSAREETRSLCLAALCIGFSWLSLDHPMLGKAREDRLTRAPEYRAVWLRRLEIVAEGDSSSEQTVPALPYPRPNSIHFIDLSTHPDDWGNACFADYMGIKSVRVEDG